MQLNVALKTRTKNKLTIMSIKPIPGVQSSPAPDSAPANSSTLVASAQLSAPHPSADTVTRSAAQTAPTSNKPTLTAREIELRHAVPKDMPLQAQLSGVVPPVLRADVDYLHIAAEAAIEAQQARASTDRMLNDYLSNALNPTPPGDPALEQQLWASIAFEFDHLQAQSDALAGLQSTNRHKLDHLQRAIANGPPEQTLLEHARQATEFDQKLGKKRDEVALSIACRDAVLETRLVKLGLLAQH